MIDRDLSSIIHQLTNSQAAQPFLHWLFIAQRKRVITKILKSAKIKCFLRFFNIQN
jgi:hypothetical protein